MPLQLEIARESWPIAGSFTISRGSKTSADVVVVTLRDGAHVGRGECVPYPRYNETVPQVAEALEAARAAIEAGCTREQVPNLAAPHAAQNALDCALWDLEAKRSGQPTWQLAGLSEPRPLVTAFTLSLDTPEAMAEAAAKSAHRPLLKLKLGRDGDAERLRLIRKAAPKSRLIVDANEGWQPDQLTPLFAVCAEVGVELVEQPLPAGNDDALKGLQRAVTICADESAHDRAGLDALVGKYDAINIKLDKTGGLTEALALARAAQSKGLKVMTGCMLATSLAMAPALLVAQFASVVDLDGPLLLKEDRNPGIRFDGSVMYPAPPDLWG
ncbi:N-acetyl-D-Glu racemase DgcA [Aestuariivirga sp.]|uniref:N-acetyl-D-Glu racemase DgcA n=1 Tax=Aestuariivirga sp. TaxID=2650926 RepID=UPI0039E6A7D7